MGSAGYSVGTFTGGSVFHVEAQGGTITPTGVIAWGLAGTVNRVGPTAAAALPVNVAGGTLNAGTVFVSNTGTVAGTVAVSNTGTVVGTVAVSNTGTVVGTVTATAAGTQTVAGTVSVSGGTIGLSGGTISTIAAGTVAISTIAAGTVAISTIAAGTVVATAAGTQVVSGTVVTTAAVGAGKTLSWGTVNLTSGSVSLAGAPGTGTAIYVVSMTLSAGTSGIIQFLQGVGAAALSGPIPLDQYGGFVSNGQPSSPILKSAAGSQVYLSITSGIGTLGGFFSYFTE